MPLININIDNELSRLHRDFLYSKSFTFNEFKQLIISRAPNSNASVELNNRLENIRQQDLKDHIDTNERVQTVYLGLLNQVLTKDREIFNKELRELLITAPTLSTQETKILQAIIPLMNDYYVKESEISQLEKKLENIHTPAEVQLLSSRISQLKEAIAQRQKAVKTQQEIDTADRDTQIAQLYKERAEHGASLNHAVDLLLIAIATLIITIPLYLIYLAFLSVINYPMVLSLPLDPGSLFGELLGGNPLVLMAGIPALLPIASVIFLVVESVIAIVHTVQMNFCLNEVAELHRLNDQDKLNAGQAPDIEEKQMKLAALEQELAAYEAVEQQLVQAKADASALLNKAQGLNPPALSFVSWMGSFFPGGGAEVKGDTEMEVTHTFEIP